MTEARAPHSHQPEPTPPEYGFTGMSEEQRAFYSQELSESRGLHHHSVFTTQAEHVPSAQQPHVEAPELPRGRVARLRNRASKAIGHILGRRSFVDKVDTLEDIQPVHYQSEHESKKANDFGIFMAEATQHLPEQRVVAYTKAPSFAEQVVGAHERTAIFRARRDIAIANGIVRVGTSTEATEGDEITVLHHFLNEAKEVISDGPDPMTGHAPSITKAEVADFHDKLTLIGQPEFDEAIEGLASYWKQSLLSDPNQNIIVVAPNRAEGRPSKSSEYVGDHIIEKFKQITADEPHLHHRVIGYEEVKYRLAQTINEHTKIVIPEDWIASGNTITHNIIAVRRALEAAGKREMGDQIETNILVARADQVENGIGVRVRADSRVQDFVRTVAYYESPKANVYGGPLPSGIHSTEDYGFSEVIRNIGVAMARQSKKDTVLPALEHVIPEYAP